MFQLTKQSLISFSILIVLSFTTGWFLVWEIRETKEEITQLPNSVLPQQKKKAFDSYNKTLARHKITGVKDLEGAYKKVTVNNGEITFSFEVPDTWLTETRNSGEVEMNEEELREFFITKYVMESDGVAYIAYTPDQVKVMNIEDLKDIIKNQYQSALGIGIPNATVSSGGTITYYDGNGYQIDFRILSAENTKKYYGFDITKNIFSAVYKEGIAKKIFIDGKTAEMLTLIPNGDPGSDNTYVYIPLKRFSKSIAIHKQGEIPGKFESNFDHLIETMKIE